MWEIVQSGGFLAVIHHLRGRGIPVWSSDVGIDASRADLGCGIRRGFSAGVGDHAVEAVTDFGGCGRGHCKVMQSAGFQEAVEALSREDRRYHPEAYVFLRDALEVTLKRRKKLKKDTGGHVGAAELLEGFRLHALAEFGPMALTVLDYWGVRSCEDVGHMVFNLVQAGVFGKTDEDSMEDFRGQYDFREVFVLPFQPDGLNKPASGAVGDGE